MNGQLPPTSAPRTGRRQFLRACGVATSAAGIATAADAFLVAPDWLSTSSLSFGSPSTAAGRTLRIAQLSDLHLRSIGRFEEGILEALERLDPDLVLVTGDAFDSQVGLLRLDTFLAESPQRSRVLGILGNWEHRTGLSGDKIAATYEKHGARLLVNESVVREFGGASLRITGLDDFVGGRPNLAAALDGAEPAGAHLLLAHCPAQRDSLAPPAGQAIDLVLSGHTHGGQIAPFGMAIVTPSGSGRYVSGWYRDGGVPMYVSRGLGTSLVPARLGSTPELVVIDWTLG